jgi:hypothetical protein
MSLGRAKQKSRAFGAAKNVMGAQMAKFSYHDFLAAHDDLNNYIIDLGRTVVFDPNDADTNSAVTAGLHYIGQTTKYLKSISEPLRIETYIVSEVLEEPIKSVGAARERARSAIGVTDHGAAVDAIRVAVDACYDSSVTVFSCLPDEARQTISAPPEHPFAKVKNYSLQMIEGDTPKGDKVRPSDFAYRPGGDDGGGFRGRGR